MEGLDLGGMAQETDDFLSQEADDVDFSFED